MPESLQPNPPTGPDVQARLQDVARLLRQPGDLDPEARRALTELVDELSKTLETTTIPAASVTRLAESTAHLAEALHHQRQNRLRDFQERLYHLQKTAGLFGIRRRSFAGCKGRHRDRAREFESAGD